MPSRPEGRRSARRLGPVSAAVAAAALLSNLGASCGQRNLALLPGVVNDPHNLSLRRAILCSNGVHTVCST